MGYWTKNVPPTWVQNATATEAGWIDADTGELVVAIRGLATKRGTGATAYNCSFTTTNSKTKLKTNDVITLSVFFNEKVTVNSAADDVASLTISNGGSAYTTPPTIGFTGGSGTGAAATAVMGVHGTVTITAGGSGYTGTPTVAITGGGGSGATGTVQITGDAVTGITITAAGTGYTSVPTLTISGTGTLATATAKLKVVSGTITAGGSGYLTAPTVSFTGGAGTGAAATAVLGGGPYLGLTIGVNSRTASYTGGSGTNKLTFAYTIVGGDSGNWSAIAADITANGATFKDTNDGTTNTTITGVGTLFPTTMGYSVDNAAPTAGDIVLYGGARFATDSVMRFKVPFSETVVVTGTPGLDFTLGGAGKQAIFTDSSGGDVYFEYVVLDGDTCTATNVTGFGTITVGEGNITDVAGNNAPRTGLTAESFIDTAFVNSGSGSAATVSSVAGAAATYKIGDVFPITVTFSQRVNVTGTPTFAFLINGVAATATYASGDGVTAIVFNYTVQEGDNATSGQITYAANPISLNGGTIKNSSLIASTLTKTGATISSVIFNGSYPRVTASEWSDGVHPAYETDDTLELTLTFSEAVTVSQTPTIPIGIGKFFRTLSYASGSGTTELVFQYTVVAADSAPIPGQGFSVNNDIELGDGTITDAAGNAASLRFRRPAITSITFNA